MIETLHELVELTLEHMCEGGIYDHLGGGFSRYSVDEKWLKHDSSQESRRVSIQDGALSRDPKRERALIEAALADSEGRVSGPSGAATRLGIPRQTLESKIRLLRINKSRFRSRAPRSS